jgi:hypothetical protein
MRKMLTIALIGLAALFAAAFMGAWLLLPETRSAAKSFVFSAPPGVVWAKITDPQKQMNWRSDIESVEMNGPKSWTEKPKRGPAIAFTELERREPELYRLKLDGGSFEGEYVATLREVSGKTEAEFRETTTIANPLFRLFAWLVVDQSAIIETYAKDLEAALKATN